MCICGMERKSRSMFLICGNPHPPNSQVPPNLLLHFYRILKKKKKWRREGKRRWHLNKSSPPRRSSGSQMRPPKRSLHGHWLSDGLSKMTWTLSKSNPSCCLILPTLISIVAGKISMSAFFPYGKIIWRNIHLTCGSALRKPQ